MTEKHYTSGEVTKILKEQFDFCYELYYSNMSLGEILLFREIAKEIINGWEHKGEVFSQ